MYICTHTFQISRTSSLYTHMYIHTHLDAFTRYWWIYAHTNMHRHTHTHTWSAEFTNIHTCTHTRAHAYYRIYATEFTTEFTLQNLCILQNLRKTRPIVGVSCWSGYPPKPVAKTCKRTLRDGSSLRWRMGMYVCMSVCMYVSWCVHASLYTCMLVCVALRLDGCVCLYACVLNMCMRVFTDVFVCVCACAYVDVCMRVYFHTLIYTLHTRTHACMHNAYIDTCVCCASHDTEILSSTHTYICTYLHAYVHCSSHDPEILLNDEGFPTGEAIVTFVDVDASDSVFAM